MIVIVGSSDLWPTESVASRVLAIMVSTRGDLAIRSASNGVAASPTELLVRRIADRLDRRCVYFEANSAGSNAGYIRDNRMVKASEAVFAFLGAEATAIDGGTQHVVEVALRLNKPVVAYGLDNDGTMIEIGSDGFFMTSPKVDWTANPPTYEMEVVWRR